MSKEICYKFDDYAICIDVCENDLPYVCVGKPIKEDCMEKILASYDEKIVNFFSCLTNKISDLEAKLAESEKKILELQEDSIRDNQIYNEQLAEKEHELDVRTFEAEMNAITITKMRESKHQDKISFCIEKLTEVRDYVKECNSLDMVEGKVRLDIVKHIRFKIEELKKGDEVG